MSAIGKFRKTPNETKRYVIYYEDWLDSTTAELLQSATFDVVLENGTGALVEIDAHQISADGQSLSLFVSGGDDGATYQITIQVETSGGQVKEDCILVVLKDC